MTKRLGRFHFGAAAIAERRAKPFKSKKSKNFKEPAKTPRVRLATKNGIAVRDTVEDRAVTDAFSACQRSRAELETAGLSGEAKLSSALADVLKFYRLGTGDEKSRAAYAEVIRDAGIKATGNTKNPLLPAVKAVFGTINSSSLGRYAAALYLANSKGVEPDRFGQFVRDEGGLVACERNAAALLNPRKAAEKAEREKASIAVLRKAGKALKSPWLSEASPGFFEAAGFKDKDGTLTLLSCRPASEATVSRYKPLA